VRGEPQTQRCLVRTFADPGFFAPNITDPIERNLELSEELKIATENEDKLAEGTRFNVHVLFSSSDDGMETIYLTQIVTQNNLALKEEKMEASKLSKAVQDLTAQHDDMKQKHEALMDQVATLRREVKAKREGIP